jgi:hypothetical protein
MAEQIRERRAELEDELVDACGDVTSFALLKVLANREDARHEAEDRWAEAVQQLRKILRDLDRLGIEEGEDERQGRTCSWTANEAA